MVEKILGTIPTILSVGMVGKVAKSTLKPIKKRR